MDMSRSVLEWLDKLVLDGDLLGRNVENANGTYKVEESKDTPATPPRRCSNTVHYDEASPTNTNFSSIFSTPDSPATSPERGTDAFSDTSATTIRDDDEDWRPKEVTDVAPSEALSITERAESSDSLFSYEPSSEEVTLVDEEKDTCVENSLHSPIKAVQMRDPDIAVRVFITSCYQCILAGLPCSRTPPACSRCKRAGYGADCLLRRRKLPTERTLGEMVDNQTPVLLKAYREHVEISARKEALYQELYQTWLDKEARKNWVLPFNDYSLEVLCIDGRKNVSIRLPEGKGQIVHLEMKVA